jgi:hypothetical protein
MQSPSHIHAKFIHPGSHTLEVPNFSILLVPVYVQSWFFKSLFYSNIAVFYVVLLSSALIIVVSGGNKLFYYILI